MNLSPAAAQAALDYAEELAATGLSSSRRPLLPLTQF